VNAKKCKHLRKVARENLPEQPYRTFQIAAKTRWLTLTDDCVRGLYQKYKRLYRKYQQMPVLKADAAEIDKAAGVA
jgi:hypothetical protein